MKKANWAWNNRIQELIDETENRIPIKRCSIKEEYDLIKTCRFSYLKHEELIKANDNPYFEKAKNLIVEGISYRLDPHESGNRQDHEINLNKRSHYDLPKDKAKPVL